MSRYTKEIYRILFVLPFLLIPFLLSTTTHAETYYYDVTNFGADGSDSLSDADAIQEALNQGAEDWDDEEEDDTVNDTSIVVTIPDGLYYIDKTLLIRSNTTLLLSSNAIIRRMDSALGKNMLRTNMEDPNYDKYYGVIGDYDIAHDITISGGTWDGGNIYSATSVSNLIYLGHSENVTIENTTVMNCYGSHAIEFAGINNGVIRNCSITGFRYDSSNFTSEAIQLDICYESQKDGTWTPGYYSDKTECKNIVIENNTITDYPRGIGVHHTLAGHQVSNVTIKNNTFKRSSASTQGKSVVGVFLYGVKNVTVSGNTFDHYSYGAMIKVSKQVTVKKNKFKYNSLGNLIVESCDKNNGRHTFLVTSDEIGKKTFTFTCGNIKSGTVKTRGRTYKFKKGGTVKLKLKKKIKENQKVVFYGKDAYGNKYYRTYYVPKQKKTTKNK